MAVRELHLAIDNGGTKAAALLYDADFHLLASAKSGSLRANSTPAALVEAHFVDLITKLGLKNGEKIADVSGAFEKAIEDRFAARFSVDKFEHYGELVLGLAAAELFGDGLLALSGTGATMYGRIGERRLMSGGYGSAVADEGSGYWISREAMIAAIRDYEGRGTATRLTEVIASHFGGFPRERLREAIFSLYYSDKSPVAQVASLVPEVVDAAKAGDNIAADILTRAGDLMADQMLYLIRANEVGDNIPLTVSGSVWRKNPLFFDAFTAKMRAASPDRPIVIPRYQPVMGVLMEKMNIARGGKGLSPRDRDLLAEEYREFRFEI